jgi:hypothetical protein
MLLKVTPVGQFAQRPPDHRNESFETLNCQGDTYEENLDVPDGKWQCVASHSSAVQK